MIGIRGASQVSGANIILWDEANLMQELADNPDKYLTTAEQALGNYNLGPGNTSKIFDSTSHATQPVNDIKRQFVFSVITSPTLVSMLRESLYWTDLSRQIFINFVSLFICRL